MQHLRRANETTKNAIPKLEKKGFTERRRGQCTLTVLRADFCQSYP